MWVIRSRDHYQIMLGTSDKRNGLAPSVEFLFESIAEYVGSIALVFFLTEMVCDDPNPLLDMKNQGFYNIVQDEDISVVWGGPGETYRTNTYHECLPIDKIVEATVKAANSLGKSML